MSLHDDQNVSDSPRGAGAGRRIDSVDRAMLDALVDDGRISLTDLAQRVNTSRSTVHSRLQRLIDDGVISRFTAEVDHAALGLPIAALVFIDIDQHDWRGLRDQLLAIDGVEYLAMCAGRFDLMMRVRVASITALRDVLLEDVQRLDGVRSTETVFVLDEARA